MFTNCLTSHFLELVTNKIKRYRGRERELGFLLRSKVVREQEERTRRKIHCSQVQIASRIIWREPNLLLAYIRNSFSLLLHVLCAFSNWTCLVQNHVIDERVSSGWEWNGLWCMREWKCLKCARVYVWVVSESVFLVTEMMQYLN